MTLIGSFALFLAFVGTLASVICLALGRVLARSGRSESFVFAGTLASWISAIALTFCCALLVYCFMTGNTSLDYVVNNQSDNAGPLGWLYRLSGLWAGRQGSLLFWAWLISLFNIVIARRISRSGDALDQVALLVAQAVLLAFTVVLVFSAENTPFEAIDPQYIGSDGSLIGAATMWGMNALLEHWAMSIHPPTLFIGYAGMTIPFAYAVAAVAVNDAHAYWVRRVQGITLFAWLFLGVGIGLGAVWAYVVLGWGGYWGWDPVENASLLPWLIGLALIHSMTMVRKRKTYKCWSIFCACLTFTFVILGTFISRSGLISSVHAFKGDSVSIALFLVLIIVSLAAGVIGVLVRRKSFSSIDDVVLAESVASRDVAYYANNLIMVLLACLLAYLTLTAALPAPLPFAGMTISAGTYNTIARPLGILYCLLMAVCPLLSWCKTDKASFLKAVKKPFLASLIVFALLVAVFFTTLYPNYADAINRGGNAAENYTCYGPGWYYNGLAIVGLFVASLLLCTAFTQVKRYAGIGRECGADTQNATQRKEVASRARMSSVGGFISHTAMGIILVGLIGSSMYVAEDTFYISYDEAIAGTASPIELKEYELRYVDEVTEKSANGDDITYTITLEVNKDGASLGTVSPAIQIVQSTMQQKLIASVMSFPAEDLFVVFQGIADEDQLVINVKINPLIWLVWIGFALMMVGVVLSVMGKRKGSESRALQDYDSNTSAFQDGDTAVGNNDSAAVTSSRE